MACVACERDKICPSKHLCYVFRDKYPIIRHNVSPKFLVCSECTRITSTAHVTARAQELGCYQE
jgi:hypothetical protein